jgi:hypothetical protein
MEFEGLWIELRGSEEAWELLSNKTLSAGNFEERDLYSVKVWSSGPYDLD